MTVTQTPSTKKVKKLCKAEIKVMETATKRICGKELYGQDLMCPDRAQHIMPWKTNDCKIGWCEGTKPKTFKGNPAPSCKWAWTCPCECHILYDRMFAEANMERIVVENHEYRVDRSEFWMPTSEERAREAAEQRARSNSAANDAPPALESPAPGVVPAHYARTFAETPTGRLARGQLEFQVKTKCDEWLVEGYEYECTPKWLAAEIASDYGIAPPSTGAIDAVFKRWVELGFAKIEKKPTRFVGYTEDGINKGLEVMREEHRLTQAARRQQLTLRR